MKLINTTNYLLFVDEDTEIKEGDYRVHIHEKTLNHPEHRLEHGENTFDTWKIVLAYYPLTKEVKELNLPWLPNPFEVIIPNSGYEEGMFGYTDTEVRVAQNAFQEGYKAAHSKGQYSLEDIQKAISFGRGLEIVSLKESTKEVETTKFIQSLSTQRLPKEFIPEYQKDWKETTKMLMESMGDNPEDFKYEETLKTITNSEGKRELVGKYIS